MPLSQLDPYWQTRDEATVRLYHGDALEVLERLPSQSVHCAVTSPPYWGLRKYLTDDNRELGLESHPDLYVSRLVEVFRELRRVLRDDGLFWLNLGDGYNGSGSSGGQGKQDTHRVGKPDNRKGWIGLPQGSVIGIPWRVAFALQADGWILRQEIIWEKPSPMPESVTNRCTKAHEYIFMFAKKAGYFFDQFAIREKCLSIYSSSDFIPKSTKDRTDNTSVGTSATRASAKNRSIDIAPDTRNKRSVWEVPHSGYKGAHFAVFPPALILPCIKAGTSEKGCCIECGAPWKRVVERTRQATRPGENSKITDVNGARLNGEVTGNRDPERHVTSLRHLGWYPSCKCYGLPEIPHAPHRGADWNDVTNTVGVGTAVAGNRHAKKQPTVSGVNASERHLPDATRDAAYDEWVKQARELCRQAGEENGDSVDPCVVLDPFIGSGTTAVVCVGLGRYSMGIDLSEEYLKRNAIPRIEGELLGRPALAMLVPR
jgi:DNA modification methylase